MPDSSFEEFVHTSLPQLSRHAYAMTGAADPGDDLVQDTLAKMATAWRKIRHDGNPIAYARKTMANTYLSGWRTILRRPRTVAISRDWAGPDDFVLVDDRDLLQRALSGLPRDQRVVLVLGYLDDLPDDEIAVILNRKPSTIRSLRFRALSTLRDHPAFQKVEETHGAA